MITQARPGARTLVGYRVFVIRRGELCSLTPAARGREQWPARGIVDAACEKPRRGMVPHLAPAVRCTCGVYAVDSLASARYTLRHFAYWRALNAGRIIIAAVQLWTSPGRPVLVGELKGTTGYQYRAPHMRILALADNAAARKVAAKYDVPLIPEKGLEAYAREHGEQLRPGQPEASRAVAVQPVSSTPARAWVRRPQRVPFWLWTVACVAAWPLAAAMPLSLILAWRVLVLAGRGCKWSGPYLLVMGAGLWRALVFLLTNPAQAVIAIITMAVLLISLVVWLGDLVRGVVSL